MFNPGYVSGQRGFMAFRRLWAILVALLLFGEPLWGFIKWALDWRGRIDALAETYQELGGMHAIVAFFLSPPSWAPAFYPILIIGGIVLIWLDLRKQRAIEFGEVQEKYKTVSEKDKLDKVSKWLKSTLYAPDYCISQAFLFGSIVHEHYPTSDVDLIVEFKALTYSKLKSISRKLKTEVAKKFETTFGHKLHITFFCSNEPNQRDTFLSVRLKTCGVIGIICVSKEVV